MTLKDFLAKHPIINKAELARQMWPGKVGSPSRLNLKLNRIKTPTGYHRITEKDLQEVKQILMKVIEDIDKLCG